MGGAAAGTPPSEPECGTAPAQFTTNGVRQRSKAASSGPAAAPLPQGAGAVKTTASAPALLLKVVLAALALVGIVALALRSGQAPQARSKDGGKLDSSGLQRVFTKEELAREGDPAGPRPMIALMGDVFDVSSAKKYYGKGGGYGFFSGRDASRAFVTGKFQDDLNDDIEDFEDDSMAALLHWRGFYFETYKHMGRVEGAFYDAEGRPRGTVQRVIDGDVRAAAAKKEREGKRSSYPACSTRWSSTEGSEVWCDDDKYPRLLTEMISGKSEQRCACFKEVGWSNLRKLYRGCHPERHRCKLQDPPT